MTHLAISSTSAAVSDEQPNCLRVLGSASSAYTFVVISDVHFNDPRGWTNPNYVGSPYVYDPLTIAKQLKKEVRALKPAFAIVCGDIVFGLNYPYEYEGAWKTWKDAGFPVFFAVGNHDGLVSKVKRTFLGIVSPKRDGLEFWRRTIGPTYFSFSFGGMRFLSVNSYDGSLDRRDGFLIVATNWGGDLTPAQKTWIAGQLAGQWNVVPYMHHNPLGPYTPNAQFVNVAPTLYAVFSNFLQTGEIGGYGSQEWNSQETGEWLRDQVVGKAPFVFVGHSHIDYSTPYANQLYVGTTCMASDTSQKWGYRPVKVVNGAITQWSYPFVTGLTSVPAGNVLIQWTTPNDGKAKLQKATLTSGLSLPFEVVLECYIKMDTSGYTVTNGAILAKRELPNQVTKLWIKSWTPVAGGLDAPAELVVTVQGNSPAPNPYVCGTLQPERSAGVAESALKSYLLVFLLGLLPILWMRRAAARTT
jgi:hypothetical protein